MWCNIAASHRGRLYMGTRGHVCNIMFLDSCLELFVPPNVIYEQTIIKNTGWSNETEINGCVFIIIAGRKDEGLRNKNSLSNGNNIWVMDYVLKNCKSGQILIFSEVRRPPGLDTSASHGYTPGHWDEIYFYLPRRLLRLLKMSSAWVLTRCSTSASSSST